MSKVIELPKGRQREIRERRIKTNRKREERKANPKPARFTLAKVGSLLKRGFTGVLRSMFSAVLSGVILVMSVFRRPFNILLRLVLLSLVLTIGMEYMNNWQHLQLAFSAFFIIFLTIGLMAFYDSFLNSLINLKYRFLSAQGSDHD